MHKLPTHRPADADEDAILRDKMKEIEALVAAIEEGAPDCDLKLAQLLEHESEEVRGLIVKKIREILAELDAEKEKELERERDAHLRADIERKRGMFQQWLQWMMSEDTIRKMQEAFLASPVMERAVRGVGQKMANKGLGVQPGDKRELGGLSNNAPVVSANKRREKEERER